MVFVCFLFLLVVLLAVLSLLAPKPRDNDCVSLLRISGDTPRQAVAKASAGGYKADRAAT